jgi:uncharacterized protein YegP (UPF0339 family)
MRTARFQVYKAKDGWRWRLLSANNRTIATGEAHTRQSDAVRALKSVARTSRFCPIITPNSVIYRGDVSGL